MFQTTVKKALKIPGHDYLHVVGENSKGSAKIGDNITDGHVNFTITAIPLINQKKGNGPTDEVDICISPDNCNINDLIGKTLYAVS